MKYKHLKSTLLLLAISSFSFGQFSGPKKSALIGFSGNLVDFSASLPKVGAVDPGFSVMFWKGLTNNLDLSIRYNGLFTDYVKMANVNTDGYSNELEGSFHLRFLSDDHALNPFISAGIGYGNYGIGEWAPYAPLGLGIQANFSSEAYIFLQGNYRLSLKEEVLDNNTFFSLGVAQSLGKKAPPPPPPPPPVVVEEVKDRDNDGIPDVDDACPDAAGTAALKGCPDKDGDGIADKDDACPDVAGIAALNGCPDKDGDGIADGSDKCPDVAGIARYEGCPIPDTDGDGVNDEVDKCPTLAGPASNNGCPEIKEEVQKKIDYAAQNIYFATGKYQLLSKSYKGLNEAAAELKADPNLKMDIDGHTDNVGSDESNQTLSENRAKSVHDYLIKQGVPESQLKSAGYGETTPVADNGTAAGRSKNRRVELNLHYD